jgi:hypothetical protein
MKKYDVFKSQGGYAVAVGVYLDCPVVGICPWFQGESDAAEYAKKIEEYNNAMSDYEESLCNMDIEQAEKQYPHKEDYVKEVKCYV